jgi:hypothetical protein
MKRIVIQIVLLAVASFANAQLPVTSMGAPNMPLLPQLTPVSMAAPAQVKDELFAGTEKFAQGASESTEINLDPAAMEMMGANAKDKNAGLAKKMKLVVVHSYKYDKPGMYKMEDVELYRRKLEDGSWSCPVRVREKNESTDICTRLGPDHETREMVIIAAEAQELSFIHMSGNMSLDDLTKTAGGLQKR